MNYQLALDRGMKPEIAMPELPAEQKVEQPVQQEQKQVAFQLQQHQEPEIIEEAIQEQPPVVEVAPEEPVVEQVVHKTESDSAKNLRQLREKAERIERERDDYYRKMIELQNKFDSNPQQQKVNDDSYYNNNLSADDLVEGKHLSAVQKQIKDLENQVRQTRTEAVLKAQYPDFEKVVTQENIETFKEMYPQIAQTLNASTDLYATAVSAYTMIKKFGIHKDTSYDNDKLLALKNSQKPKPVASISPQKGDSPLSNANAFANGLTPDLQKQLLLEMNQARKSR